MKNKYTYKKFDDVIFNVDGPHPGQFNLDRYNDVIAMTDNTQSRLDLLNSVIGEVDGFAKEYNRQSIYHAERGDYTNSAIAASWRKTAYDVLGELMAKKNALVRWLANPRNQLTAQEVPQTGGGLDLSGGLGTGNAGGSTDTGAGTDDNGALSSIPTSTKYIAGAVVVVVIIGLIVKFK